MTTSESIFKWMEENKDFFKAQAICKKVGIDKGNFSKYKKEKSIPQKYIIPIFDIITPLGFKIETLIEENNKPEVKKKILEEREGIKNVSSETIPEGLNWKEKLEWKRNHKK